MKIIPSIPVIGDKDWPLKKVTSDSPPIQQNRITTSSDNRVTTQGDTRVIT